MTPIMASRTAGKIDSTMGFVEMGMRYLASSQTYL